MESAPRVMTSAMMVMMICRTLISQTSNSSISGYNFSFNFSNYQPKNLKACQVSRHHVKFEESCPSGSMTLEKFVELSREALGDQADFLSEALFRFL